MSLETQVQNLATEATRRWKSVRGRGDESVRRETRDLLAKLAFGTWLLASDLLRAAVGSRLPRQTLSIRRFQSRLRDADEDRLLALLADAVSAVSWHLILARRDGVGVRRIEPLVARFLDAAEEDLVRLNRATKR